jgi:hypothetical protein
MDAQGEGQDEGDESQGEAEGEDGVAGGEQRTGDSLFRAGDPFVSARRVKEKAFDREQSYRGTGHVQAAASGSVRSFNSRAAVPRLPGSAAMIPAARSAPDR